MSRDLFPDGSIARRIYRTLDSTLTVVFGEPDRARAALRRMDRRRASVTGTARDGRAYRASGYCSAP